MHDPEVIDVRPDEHLDVARLEPYLRDRLEATGSFALRQFGGGHANLTYLVSFGDREWVLRRPPLGPVPANAHDMKREYAVLSKLYSFFPLAPRSFLLCTEPSVIGADFVIEERKHGIAIRRDIPQHYRGDAAFCRQLGERIIDTLADLHAVDYVQAGLETLGRPDGYVARQLEGWTSRYEAAQTLGAPDVTTLVQWLRERLPTAQRAAIVHNDYKLDNMLLDPREPSRIVAVLDWDMCTIGDPLMDVGYVLALWAEQGDPPAFRAGAMPTWHPGFPSRREAVGRYSDRTGLDVRDIGWYHVFNIFRFAAILQQIYKRFEAGQTHDERFAAFGAQVNALIATAKSLSQW